MGLDLSTNLLHGAMATKDDNILFSYKNFFSYLTQSVHSHSFVVPPRNVIIFCEVSPMLFATISSFVGCDRVGCDTGIGTDVDHLETTLPQYIILIRITNIVEKHMSTWRVTINSAGHNVDPIVRIYISHPVATKLQQLPPLVFFRHCGQVFHRNVESLTDALSQW